MNEEASAEFGAPSLAFYKSKGLVWSAQGTAELATVIGCEEGNLNAALTAYGEAAVGGEGDAYGKTVFPSKDWRLDQEFRKCCCLTRCFLLFVFVFVDYEATESCSCMPLYEVLVRVGKTTLSACFARRHAE